MTRPHSARRFTPAAALLLLAACGDDPKQPEPTRGPMTIVIPDDMSLEQAAAEAVPGDTLFMRAFLPLPALEATVVFASARTPLLVRGDKSVPVLRGTGAFPLLRFDSPRAGTRIESITFQGGAPALEVTGAGALTVSRCRFRQGGPQVHAEGEALTMTLEGSIFEKADGFAVRSVGAALIAERNTVVRPSEGGVGLAGASVGTLTANIVWRSNGPGILCEQGAVLDTTGGCNDVFECAGGGYSGCAPLPTDFALDPEFCDPVHGDYTLVSTSPCSPSPACGRVGALDVACEPGPFRAEAPLRPGSR